jgi:Zn/Cd-binding protein ZinT
MIDRAFNSFYKDSVSKYLIIEQQTGIIKHLTHLEELILTRQKEGLDIAIQFINALSDSFNSNVDAGITTTVKYDGAPAIVCGYNPENNNFFVSLKSADAKVPKINYTIQDVQLNYGQNPGLAEKMRLALLYLPKVIKQNIYQCDFMFDKATLKEIEFQGEKLIAFKPNTVTYAVEANSELGNKVKNAQIGVVFHTRYTGKSLQQLTNSADVNILEFNQAPEVWFDDAKFKDVSGIATLTDDEKRNIEEFLKSIQKTSNVIDWTSLPSSVYALINIFINTLIRQYKFVDDPEEAFSGFTEWYNIRLDKDIKKLENEKDEIEKSDDKKKEIKIKRKDAQIANKTEAKNKAIQFINNNKMSMLNIFNLTKKIAEIKKIFINKYSAAIKTKQFLAQPDGTLKVTPGEGFVAIDKVGNKIKLVDRLEFSRANFSVSREDKFK